MKTLHFQKLSVKVVTIILFSFGIVCAVLIGYNYFTMPHVISKQQAIAIAMHSDSWTREGLGNATIDAELLQAKLSNRVDLVINDTTMSTNSYPGIMPLPSLVFQENQLFWDITIKKHLMGMEYKQWQYLIDAKNSTLIEKMDP
ncbi:MAG: hypothetical protein ACYDAJ_11415 [Nitrosotalea sp.]